MLVDSKITLGAPKVILESTNILTLSVIEFDLLKKFSN